MATEKITESKSEYESRYGKWLREMRLEIKASLESVAAAVNIDLETLKKYESGHDILLYDAMRLTDFYGVED
ncbi:MAG: helix-turn-helix domain-containing protein [Lachnospiraceae bacterium]|nr:helix-turn-helix domain-containing protein [Lachnospiraceae bacterium]